MQIKINLSMEVECAKCGKKDKRDIFSPTIYEKDCTAVDFSKYFPNIFIGTPSGWREIEQMAICEGCYEKIRKSQEKAHSDFHEFIFGYRVDGKL